MSGVGRLPIRTCGSIALLLLMTACTTGAGTTTSPSTQPVVESDFSAMTGEEQVAAFVSCLNARGFPVVLLEDNELDSSAVPRTRESQARYRQASEACGTDVAHGTLGGLIEAEQSKDQLSALYHRSVDIYGCVVAHGYVPAEPPSEKMYVESQGEAWYPYEGLNLPSDEFEQLQDLCSRP